MCGTSKHKFSTLCQANVMCQNATKSKREILKVKMKKSDTPYELGENLKTYTSYGQTQYELHLIVVIGGDRYE